MDTNIISAIETGNLVEAHNLLEGVIFSKLGRILEEKKKQVVAKTWGKSRHGNLMEADSKGVLNASKRKAFKEKMKKLAKVKAAK